MSLIEKYGSYEATKEKYQALSDSDMITIGPVEFSAKDYFEDELLEYRRQHNIFEVGDKIVFVDDFMHDEIMKVSDGNNVEVYMDDDRKRANIEMVRHANDNEIKENRRILSLTQLF